MGFRFANVVGTTRYDIPELGENVWIECRDELTVGEKRELFNSAVKGETPLGDGKVRIEYDTAKLAFATVLGYLSDWSQAYIEDKDKRAEIKTRGQRDSAIRALDDESFKVLERYVEAHIEAKKSLTSKSPAAPGSTTTTSTS